MSGSLLFFGGSRSSLYNLVLPGTVNVVVEGAGVADSLGASDTAHGWLQLAKPQWRSGPNYTLQVVATPEASLGDMLTNYSSRVGAAYVSAAALNILIIMAGDTDSSASTDSTPEAKYRSIRQLMFNARQTGYDRVVVCTLLPRNSGNPSFWDGSLKPLNTYIRAFYNNDLHCDSLIDFAQDNAFDEIGDVANSTYYNVSSGYQLTNAGYALMAPYAVSPISSILLNPGSRTAGPEWWMGPDSPFPSESLIPNNRNLLFAPENGTQSFYGSRSVTGHHSGKWKGFWFIGQPDVGRTVGVGFYNELFNNYLALGTTNSLGLFSDGTFKLNTATLTTPFTTFNGESINFAIDLDAKLLWLNKIGFNHPNVKWNNSPTANPATGVGGIDISSISTGRTLYAAGQVQAFPSQLQYLGHASLFGDNNADSVEGFNDWASNVDQDQIVVLPPPPAPAPAPPPAAPSFTTTTGEFSLFTDSYWLVEELVVKDAGGTQQGLTVLVPINATLQANVQPGTTTYDNQAVSTFQTNIDVFKPFTKTQTNLLLITRKGVVLREAVYNGSSPTTYRTARSNVGMLIGQAFSTTDYINSRASETYLAIDINGYGNDYGTQEVADQCGFLEVILRGNTQVANYCTRYWQSSGQTGLVAGFQFSTTPQSGTAGYHYVGFVPAPPPPPPAPTPPSLRFTGVANQQAGTQSGYFTLDTVDGRDFTGTVTVSASPANTATFTQTVFPPPGPYSFRFTPHDIVGNQLLQTSNDGSMTNAFLTCHIAAAPPPPAGPSGTVALTNKGTQSFTCAVGTTLYFSIQVPAGQSALSLVILGGGGSVNFNWAIDVDNTPTQSVNRDSGSIAGSSYVQKTEGPQAGLWVVAIFPVAAGTGYLQIGYNTADIPASSAISLTNGVQTTAYTSDYDAGKLFSLVVPSGTYDLFFSAIFTDSSPDIYIKLNDAPKLNQPSSYDYHKASSGNSPLTFDIAPPSAGTYYILIKASNQTFQNMQLTATYTYPVANTSTSISGATTGGFIGIGELYTFSANGSPPEDSSPLVITPSDNGGGGTWSPTTVSISRSNPTGTSVYTPGSGGTKTLSGLASGLTAPTLSYVVSPTAPTVTTVAIPSDTTLSAGANSSSYFKVTVPTYTSGGFASLIVQLKFVVANGGADIYLKKGSLPSTAVYDTMGSISGTDTNQTSYASIYSPTSNGDYYILVKGLGTAYTNAHLLTQFQQ